MHYAHTGERTGRIPRTPRRPPALRSKSHYLYRVNTGWSWSTKSGALLPEISTGRAHVIPIGPIRPVRLSVRPS
eukprot:4372983-Prymnesium_polylepis.1